MRSNLQRASARLPIFTILFAVLLTVTASSLAAAVGLPGVPAAPGVVPAGAIVRVDVTGAGESGAVTATAYGVVVDPTGLILAPANVVAPSAPGVAVGWQWPISEYTVSQIVVSTSAGAGQPFKPAYMASVATVDGIVDTAVLKLDSAITATGALTPVPAGSLNLPAVPVAAADPAVGAPILVATYPEKGTTPSGLGTYTEIPGKVTSFGSDIHVPGKNYWLNTDVPTPVTYPGGAIVDATGALVGLISWLADSPPEHVYGPTAGLMGPVIAAAKAGTPYTSPYVVPGSGAEQAKVTGFGTSDPPCNTTTPVTTYPTGTKSVAALLSYSGFTDGEDLLDLWFDPDKQQILTYSLFQSTYGPSGTCLSSTMSANTGALPDGNYGYNLFAGGDLHFLTGAKAAIGEPAPAGVHVTGRVVDADTGKPIPLVIVYVLNSGVDPQTFLNSGTQADVASVGLTDDQGLYSTDPAVAPGKYPFLVIPSDNHQAVGGTVTIPADGKLPDITLTAGT